MGNQGTTNWKFSAFFAIVLMLVAGAFSTAIAGNGDGQISVTAPAEADQPMTAGATAQTVTLTYTAFNDTDGDGEFDTGETAINMNGGSVKIMIPGDGWKVPAASITVNEGGATGTLLYFTDSVLLDTDSSTTTTDDDTAGTTSAGVAASDAVRRVKVTKDGDNITAIEIELDDAWGSNRTGDDATTGVNRSLVVSFPGVTVAIPSSLAYTDGRESTPYRSYEFTTMSKSKNGVFARLKPTAARRVTQPRIQVGSIGGAASGEATVEPATAYAGDKYTFMIKFKALGPLYDDTTSGSEVDNDIVITPTNDVIGSGGELEGALPSLSNVSISRTRGNVRFESPRYTVNETTRAITVHIARMDKDAEVHVSYGPVTIPATLAAADDSPDASIFGVAAGPTASPVTLTKAVGGGRTQSKAGSGKLTISPDVIEAGSKRRTFTLTYEALTDVEGVLAISLPTYDADGTTTSIFRYDDPTTQAVEMTDIGGDQVSSPDSTEATKTVATAAGVTTITWDSLTLKKGNKFRTVIKSADVPMAAFGKKAITATMAAETMTMVPHLYVVETEPNSVTFSVSTSAEVTAGSKQTVTLTFMADKTPIIKGGNIRVQLPSDWTGATTGDADGKVTARKINAGPDGDITAETDNVPTGIDVKRISASGRTIRVNFTDTDLAVGEHLEIKYGDGKQATVQSTAGTVQISGFFKASPGSPERSAGRVQVDVVNAANGSGTATITPTSVRAGSTTNRMVAVYTAAGTMDGGSVAFEIPSTWGAMQRDPLKRNYINVTVSGGALSSVDYGSTIVVANLTTLRPNGRVTFTYGGGTGSSANRGAEAQVTTGPANFMIESDGNGDGVSVDVKGTRDKAAVKDANPDALGETFTDAAGVLKVMVGGADDGTGTAAVRIVDTRSGAQDYPDPTDSTKTVNEMRIHAGDNATYLEFTYKPGQTIEEGQLKFTVPGGWSDPQGDDPLMMGYTRVVGGEPAAFNGNSLTVDIIRLDQDESIVIHYGEYFGDQTEGGAMVPGVATAASRFAFAVRGTATGSLTPLRDHRDTKLDVQIWKQASGGGTAMIETTDGEGALGAGDVDRTLTITYTASGQFDGKVKLTTPDKWTAPMMEHFDITSTGTVGSAMYGGYYTAKEMDLPEGLGARDVIVDSVMLDAGETVTFVYKGVMVQPTAADGVAFGVASMGSDGPGTGFIALTAPTVDVGEANPGSGTAKADPMFATAGTSGNTLTVTYTVAGDASYPKDIRVAVPTGWSVPTNEAAADANKGTYKVELMRDGKVVANVVEKIAPIDRSMVARILPGGVKALGGDMVVFTYQNADAPAAPARSMFRVNFNGTEIDNSPTVVVTSAAGPAMLAVEGPSELSVDSGDAAMLTIKLQDAGGNAAAIAGDTEVTLTSSSSQGMFSMTDGGAAISTVTISGGYDQVMVYYKDTVIGTSTITARAAASGLTSGTASIMVTTETTEITAVSFAPSVAKSQTPTEVGTEVTVTARATPGRMATFSVGVNGLIVNGRPMTETSGSYSGSFTPVKELHDDGMYPVSVTVANQSMAATGQLTIDGTAPTVTVAAIEGTVANDGDVMISAAVADAGTGVASVMADVSMLDDQQTAAVALTDADGDGTYTGTHTISAENGAANGSHTITVTAMDNAGNSGMGSTDVELLNTLTFTSTLPQGISLFHVPLDVEGLDTVGDLEAELGDNVNLLITYDGASWNSRSSGVAITASLGILVSVSAETTVTFEGHAWADTSITLAAGSNLIGLPVNDARVTNASDISGLFADGTVSSVIVASGGSFQAATAADSVAGDAAYLVIATAAGSVTLTGDGWSNGATGAAPIALAGYTVDNQTPALNVHGSVVDEITGLAKEGFRVKVKNLSTKSALSHITDEATDGYDMTFVDLADSYAARVGDVLEITADSPDPLIGVQPIRHIVTVDDVKNSTIQLEELIAYEIPAETELLRNYPNPFNPETWIPYHLSEDADVSLTIYDVNGALVRDIDVGHQTAAKYDTRSKAIYWDGRNQFGEQVASGIYFYSLSAGDFSATRKMVILK